MKIAKKKTMATLIALILIFPMIVSTSLTIMPGANAHDPAWTIPTSAYVVCTPNPVAVGQTTTIVMWLNVYPMTASGLGGDRWRNWSVNITQPDGTTINVPYTGVTSTVGSSWMTYTPTEVGTYTLVFSWPGQTLTNGTGTPSNRAGQYVGDYFEGATSAPYTLTVQQDPIKEWVESPLPTDFWTRPISTTNRNWAPLASNYLKGSWLRNPHFQEEGRAPNSAHILWTKPIYQYGGIADARGSTTAAGTPLYGAVKVGPKDYEDFMPNPIIMDGKIYYNAYTYPWYGYYCVDLLTGATTYYKNGTDNGLNNFVKMAAMGSSATIPLTQTYPQLSFAQLYSYYGINGAGIEPYLWMTQSGMPQTATGGGTTWYMLDANTGNWILTLKNVPGGTSVTDEQGDLLLYSYNRNTGNFLCWNSSQSIPPSGPTGTPQQQWKPPEGSVIDAVNDNSWTVLGPNPNAEVPYTASDILPRSGYTMNYTDSSLKGLPVPSSASGLSGLNVLQDKNNVPKEIVLSNFPGIPSSSYPMASEQQVLQMAVLQINQNGAYSPFPDKTPTQNNNLGFSVSLLWNKNITYPIATGNKSFTMGAVKMIDYDNQVFCLWCKETQQYWGYDLNTGNLLWGPTEPTGPMDYYDVGQTQGSPGYFGYGMLFNAAFAGHLVAYNITTGQKLWDYNATSVGAESPYGANYPLLTATIADGKLFEVSGEHSATQPMWRGSYIRAINATTGQEIWKLQHFVIGNNDRMLSIADGYIVASSDYDGQLYCIGKGPSATTVSAPLNGVSTGSSFTILGTVTDQSAGTQELYSKALYPNGVPAVSDASQEGFMEYLYQQQIKPTNTIGVPVSLDAIDPNGNFVHLGDAISDASGFYSFAVDADMLSAGSGTYKVIATFAGSESYGSSSAETAFVVSASAATSTPQPQEAPDNTTTIVASAIGTGIAVIIAIAIVGILILRKRP